MYFVKFFVSDIKMPEPVSNPGFGHQTYLNNGLFRPFLRGVHASFVLQQKYCFVPLTLLFFRMSFLDWFNKFGKKSPIIYLLVKYSLF
jgi:hypothetical protein